MLKKCTLIVMLLSAVVCAQNSTLNDWEEITLNMTHINEALIAKDTSALAVLLHNDLTLGHSNGWLETKPNLLKTLVEEGVIYTSIETIGEPEIHYSSEKLKTTRRNIDVSGILSDTTFGVKLNVLEVWILENGTWQLLARQSVNRRE